MSNKHSLFVLTVLVGVAVLLGFIMGFITHTQLSKTDGSFSILTQAYNILRDQGLKDTPPHPALEYGMIKGMLQAYGDPYTRFVEPIQHELETDDLEGAFGGIGVRMERDIEGHVTLHPFPDSPAAESGILDGDRLLAVDNLTITPEISMETLQAALRGPEGEHVRVTIGHFPAFFPIEIDIKRVRISLPSVTWHLDPGEPRLGVIEINLIAESTPGEVQRAFEDLKTRKAEVFVIDLRDNYGGLLTAGVDTARLFLSNGTVIEQQYRGKDVETYKVERPGSLVDLPVAILINQNTASAAEIIAGALQFNERAKLIGSPTYGKDTIQLVFDLQDGSSLHVTAARWWIPTTTPLGGYGLQPDISIPTDGSNTNASIQSAIQMLLGTR